MFAGGNRGYRGEKIPCGVVPIPKRASTVLLAIVKQ